MKNRIKICCFLSLLTPIFGFSYGYQQYGFSEYKEQTGITSFSCENQCYIMLGKKGNIDYMKLKGILKGNGNIIYGFILGEQIAQISQQNIFGQSNLNDSINFLDNKQYFSSIPEGSDIIVLINGNIKGDLDIYANNFGFGEKLKNNRKSFRNMETFTPYSINLRYGVNINGTSVVKYGYIVFIILAILIFLFNKGKREQKLKIIFYIGIGIFLLIGIRNTITYTSILHQGLSGFKNNKTYFDLGDYIQFTDEIRKELKLDTENYTKDDCRIYIDSYQEWPFTTHRENFYIKPCERVFSGELADYIIYYKKDIAQEDKNKKILINQNNNYLLKNNSK